MSARPTSTRCGRRSTDNGLAEANLDLISDIIACPGLDYCSLANARSIPVAQKIATRFADLGRQRELGELKLKISGCINACGHHHAGHIGILGVDKKGTENYQLLLGGSGAEDASLGKITGPGFSRGRHRRRDRARDRQISRGARRRRTLPRHLSPRRVRAVQGGDLWLISCASATTSRTKSPRSRSTRSSPASPMRRRCGWRRARMRARCSRISTTLALIEIDFPALPRRARLFVGARAARGGLYRRTARGGRRAGRPDRSHAPLRVRQLRALRADRPGGARSVARRATIIAISPPPTTPSRCGSCGMANALRKIDLIDTAPAFTQADADRLNARFAGVDTLTMLQGAVRRRHARQHRGRLVVRHRKRGAAPPRRARRPGDAGDLRRYAADVPRNARLSRHADRGVRAARQPHDHARSARAGGEGRASNCAGRTIPTAAARSARSSRSRAPRPGSTAGFRGARRSSRRRARTSRGSRSRTGG